MSQHHNISIDARPKDDAKYEHIIELKKGNLHISLDHLYNEELINQIVGIQKSCTKQDNIESKSDSVHQKQEKSSISGTPIMLEESVNELIHTDGVFHRLVLKGDVYSLENYIRTEQNKRKGVLNSESLADIIAEKDSHGRIPLFLSCYITGENACRIWIKLIRANKEASVQHKDNDGRNMLHYIAQAANHECFRTFTLLTTSKMYNPLLIEQDNKYGMTPLHISVLKGDEHMTKSLLKLYSNAFQSSEIKSAQIEKKELNIERGVDISDFKGNTPLHYAVFGYSLHHKTLGAKIGKDASTLREKNEKEVKKTKTNRFSISFRNDWTRTKVDDMANSQKNELGTEMKECKKDSTKFQPKTQHTGIVTNDYLSIIEELLKHGANTSKINHKGKSPFSEMKKLGLIEKFSTYFQQCSNLSFSLSHYLQRKGARARDYIQNNIKNPSKKLTCDTKNSKGLSNFLPKFKSLSNHFHGTGEADQEENEYEELKRQTCQFSDEMAEQIQRMIKHESFENT